MEEYRPPAALGSVQVVLSAGFHHDLGAYSKVHLFLTRFSMASLTIGQLAQISEVSADTIRFYEKLRLLIPTERSRAGYRLYGEDGIARLIFIRRAKQLGFTLNEIKKLLSLNAKRNASCDEMLILTNAKIRELKGHISDLSRMGKILMRLAKNCPGGSTPIHECPILDFVKTSPLPKSALKRNSRR
jgi:MerR family transcriptional regulator, copper efflux regulator